VSRISNWTCPVICLLAYDFLESFAYGAASTAVGRIFGEKREVLVGAVAAGVFDFSKATYDRWHDGKPFNQQFFAAAAVDALRSAMTNVMVRGLIKSQLTNATEDEIVSIVDNALRGLLGGIIGSNVGSWIENAFGANQ
jgi:hypothetical protein